MKTSFFTFVILIAILYVAAAATGEIPACPESCEKSKCEDFKCPSGSYVNDTCGCCEVCVRRRTEVCGGRHDRFGRCEDGLKCVVISTEAYLGDQESKENTEEEEEEDVVGICQGPQDCVLSSWTKWTKCSEQCGFGTMKRHRTVLQEPKNGGKPCPTKHEKKGCFQQKCKENMVLAQILPAEFRRPELGSDEFDNILPDKKTLTKIQQIRKKFRSHCVNFKLMSKHPYCHGTWAEKLKLSKPMCVECQPAIMDDHGYCKGEGIVGNFTSWIATDTETCSGLWMRVGEKIPNCKCTDKKFQNFIFV